ncbi:AMP-binding protein (plasmid) [Kitasatospora sp. NBC_00374]|uniref:AMP-binding protein n=1 Tax=Kitasatospora sp. NBC_00374 TaxID=2975964 RepID=UPI002F91B627
MLYTVSDLLEQPAHRHPDNVAVQDGATTLTYRQLADQAQRCAGFLTGRAQPGERIAMLLPRSAQTLALWFGAHLAALVPVLIHDQLRPRQVAHILQHCEPALTVTNARTRPLLRECALDPARTVDADSVDGPPLTATRRIIGRDLAALSYTSGSTGSAKGVMLSHDNLVAGALIVADYLHLTAADRTLALLPWSFDYGLNQVLATFAAAGTVVVQRSALPAHICRTLTAADITGLAGVPTLWHALTSPASPFLHGHYPHLRYLTNSGGALPGAAVRAVHAAHPDVEMFAMYGLTEAFRSTYLPPTLLDTKPDSIGRAIPNSELLVLDEQGTPCPPGTVGQFIHRGPTVALGYWRDPEATAQVFRPHQAGLGGRAESVVHTGDFGYADHDGDLYYLGRRDDLFKSRGHRVTCLEIERELTAGPLVTAAVVLTADRPGQDDPEILAAVQPGPDYSTAAFDAYCQRELPAHMRPHHITVLEQLPSTPNGKVDREAIRPLLAPAPLAQAPR